MHIHRGYVGTWISVATIYLHNMTWKNGPITSINIQSGIITNLVQCTAKTHFGEGLE
jgi:hypothetical protein